MTDDASSTDTQVRKGSIKGFERGDPRNERIAAKRETILAAARTLFMRDGYAATALDAVAREAGVSRMTLYRHFGSKEVLFTALLGSVADELAQATREHGGDSAAERLLTFGLAFARRVTSDEVLALYRIIVAEAVRFPELSRGFQMRSRNAVVDHAAAIVAEGTSADADEALERARDFDAMVLGDVFQRRLLGIEVADQNDRLVGQVERAVAHVLR